MKEKEVVEEAVDEQIKYDLLEVSDDEPTIIYIMHEDEIIDVIDLKNYLSDVYEYQYVEPKPKPIPEEEFKNRKED